MWNLIIKYGMKFIRFITELFGSLKTAALNEIAEIKQKFNDVSPAAVLNKTVDEGVRFFGTALVLEGLDKYPTSIIAKVKPFVNLPYEDCIYGHEVKPLLLMWRLGQQMFYKHVYGIDYVRTTFTLGF